MVMSPPCCCLVHMHSKLQHPVGQSPPALRMCTQEAIKPPAMKTTTPGVCDSGNEMTTNLLLLLYQP
jgi:hypothetical protein